MDYSKLEVLSITQLKALQVTIAETIERKKEAMRIKIKQDAIDQAIANDIDPKTIFSEPQKRKRKPAEKPSAKPVLSSVNSRSAAGATSSARP